jgi:D-amino-acid dehydrogenase
VRVLRIIVIGAGIVGMASAWWLARDGHRVTVVDRATAPGQGTSFANGAQLSYSFVAPMASPSVLRNVPKWLLKSDSPIRFVPTADPGQWRWIMQFLASCNAGRSAASTAKMLALSYHSRAMLHSMMAETPMAFDHAANGKIVVQSSRQGMADAEAQMRVQAALGSEQQALTAAECLAMEPGLASIAGRLVGGIYTPGEEVGDCRKLCGELMRVLPEVEFRLGTEVRRLVLEGGRVRALETSAGALEAELYVLAAGPGSRALGRGVGVRTNILPIRGYSISPSVLASNLAPVRSITDTYVKTVYAPLGGALRVAGFAEIAGEGTEIRPDRIATLAANVASTFPGACAMDELHPWAGLRPSTPWDMPAIGRSRVANLMLNLGQGSLGFTLAAGSGRLLADLVAGRTPAVNAEHFAPR